MINIFVNIVFGCNKLELEEFNGVMSCKGFYPGYEDWQDRYYKALKGEVNKENK